MKYIIANWKMNPQSAREAVELFQATLQAAHVTDVTTIVCPPFVYLDECAQLLRAAPSASGLLQLGAQDTFWLDKGPFTGEVSPSMLREFDVRAVLIGHSDRRYVIGETDEMINKKIKAALALNITPILLVGEREKDDVREDVLVDQLARDLEGLIATDVSRLMIAYEPVWAISTNTDAEADSPDNTLTAITLIKSILTRLFALDTSALPPMLYGGSINESNVRDFLSHPEIQGAVIGGASLRADEFGRIIKIASEL